MSSFLEQVGERIRRQREGKGYTAREISKKCGVHSTMLNNIESGRYKPPYSLYEDICILIGTSFQEVMKGFRWTYTPPLNPSPAEAGEGSKAA